MKNKSKVLLTIGVVVISVAIICSMTLVYFSIKPDGQEYDENWTWGVKLDPSGERVTTPGEITTFASDGCYTWWTNALALRHVGKRDQTYLSYVNENGQMSLASFDHKTGEFAYNTLADYEKDDHNSAALTILPNGKILAVYARHSADKFIRWRISDRVEDITSFGEEQTIKSSSNVTYIQLHRISATEYRIFYRYATSKWSTRIYNWVEDTWTDEIVWLQEPLTKQYYLWTQEDKEEGKINVFMTAHPVNGPDQNIRYGYFDECGDIYTTGGKYLGNLDDKSSYVLTPRDFDVVYEAQEGEHTRLYDVSFMGDEVAVMYGVGLDGYNSKYYYAYYDDTRGEWVNNFICESGEAAVTGNMYFGGVSFDKKDMQTIYVSRRVSGFYQMEKWTTKDYGATWDTQEVIDVATDKSATLMRPIIPYNASDDIDVIYIKGLYPTYTTYNTDIVFYAD